MRKSTAERCCIRREGWTWISTSCLSYEFAYGKRRHYRALCLRVGSASPPSKKQKKIQPQGLYLFCWCGRRDLILARTARSVFHGRGRPPEVRSVPFPLQVPVLINQKGYTTRAYPLCLVRTTGLEPTWIASLEPETSASANSATSAFLSFRPLFLHGENSRDGAYSSDKSYFSAYSAMQRSAVRMNTVRWSARFQLPNYNIIK